jgi:mRNA interferase RelE/StbE
MAKYRLEIKRSAEKEIESIPQKDRIRIVEKILTLSDNPRPLNAIKLSGEEKYRIRQGNFRILYEIHDEIVTVIVVRVAHRREIYKKRN